MQPAVVNDTPVWFVHVYGCNHQFILHTCNVCVSSVIIVLTVSSCERARLRKRKQRATASEDKKHYSNSRQYVY